MDKVIGYIGSKQKLYGFLEKRFFDNFHKDEKIKFVDAFSGTGVVSKLINENTNWDIIMFDISLYSKILSSNILNEKIRFNLEEKLLYLDNLELIDDGYIFNELGMGGKSKTIDKDDMFEGQLFNSRMFFTEQVSKKIDTIKCSIKEMYLNNEINEFEKDLLLLFLLNYADRNANTTSVYGAYLKYVKHKVEKSFLDKKLISSINNKKLKNNKLRFITNDILNSLEQLEEVDLIYFDPPYNTRRYESNYHILNYISDLGFDPFKDIKFNSKTATLKNLIKNPFSNKLQTKVIFKKMILLAFLKTNIIFISYNNEGIISEEWMSDFCKKNNFTLITHKQDYKRFTSGENKGSNNGKNNKIIEILWEIKK